MTNIKKKHDVDTFIWLSLCAFKRRKWRLNCKKSLDSLAWHSRVSPAPFIQVSITTWDAFKYFISVLCSFHTHTEQWRLVSAVFVCLFVYLFACLLLLLLFLRFFLKMLLIPSHSARAWPREGSACLFTCTSSLTSAVPNLSASQSGLPDFTLLINVFFKNTIIYLHFKNRLISILTYCDTFIPVHQWWIVNWWIVIGQVLLTNFL